MRVIYLMHRKITQIHFLMTLSWGKLAKTQGCFIVEIHLLMQWFTISQMDGKSRLLLTMTTVPLLVSKDLFL